MKNIGQNWGSLLR